jgi:uncharacterized protein YbjT (DUF2867 family)
MSDSLNIIIAGASGYIGKALMPKLLERFPKAQITALSRSLQKSDDPRITWKACDLFSLKSIEEATPQKIDLAFYLVHSMGPTAQLDQGSFADYDLLLADNFARSMKKAKIKHMIYLGGIIPEGIELSLHLQSRLEVEETFAQYKLPLTVFRAGLILGAAGSSFQILLKLVRRLPVMICPHWTQTLTTPVDLHTVLTSLTEAAFEPKHINQTYDLAGCQPLTYVQMMQETSRRLKLKRYFIPVPFFTPTLSRLWVRLITNTPKDLVYPLIESLEHPMVAKAERQFTKDSMSRTYFELLESAFLKTRPGRAFFHFTAQRKTVRSVQRLLLPEGKDALWVKNQYVDWLPNALSPLIKASSDGTTVTFSVRLLKIKLLILQISTDRSDADRQLCYINGGILVAGDKSGRLEFRVVLNRKHVLVAIHDFKPALPWYIYKYTQALAHLLVMRAFAKYLNDINLKTTME